MNIDLREYESSEPIALCVAQRDALSSTVPQLGVVPEQGEEGRYLLTPGPVVGAFEVGDLSVLIRPKLGIPKLIFLACYAMDDFTLRLGERHYFEDADTLPDAMALSLAVAARKAFERGLLHGYRTEEESLYTVRGRIRMGDQIRRRFSLPFPVEVRYDEFTEDIVANQLVKAAAWQLGRMRLRHQKARDGLREVAARLGNVSLVEFPPHDVPEVKFDRLNERYREVVMLSRLVLRRRLFESGRGAVPAPGFHMDMNRVFQRFVTRALREALRVSDQTLRSDSELDRSHRISLDEDGHITLKPDLSWWDGPRCTFVGDAKYKRIESNVPNADLYQLLAYATARDLPGGLLIYAKGERPPASYRVRNAGKCLEIAEVDLDGDPDELMFRICELAKRVLRIRAASRPGEPSAFRPHGRGSAHGGARKAVAISAEQVGNHRTQIAGARMA